MPTVVTATDWMGFYVGQVQLTTHGSEQCEGRACVIHRPSNHHMRHLPLHWRGDVSVMERTCIHGVGHPDPDDAAWNLSQHQEWKLIHGCDGCCVSHE